MANDKKAESQAAKSEPMPATGCVVCGVDAGKLIPAHPDTAAGAAPRWHAACASSRPDVISKVQARA